jgi:hypothetical protein
MTASARLVFPILALIAAGCASHPRRFTRTTVLWVDDDRQPFAPRPPERFAPEMWDAADNLLFRPMARALAFETHGESTNVNAWDEVPDSSWFTNRIGRHPMTPEEVARGACHPEDPMPRPPWRVVEGKTEGGTAGFVFEDALERRYVLKADRDRQPEQATAADAIGAALYHAVGYFVPCNRVVHFDPSWVELAPDARIEVRGSGERAMTREDLRGVFAELRQQGGRLRGLASLYLEGTPLGPWDYRGTRSEDLNDVVLHQNRRELRGMYVLNAWVNHWDARQHNTLATWIEVGDDGAGYVRHNLIDFGDILGFVQRSHRAVTRYGYSEWFDTQHIFEDFITLGIPTRPWDVAEPGPTWPVLGYFDVERFEPDQWRPNYWNGAFEQHTERDAAWMARIIARFTDAHLRALVALGRWSDPAVERRLLEVLRGRRAKILDRYLDRLSPLVRPELARGRVCLEDLAVTSGLRAREGRRYRARIRSGDGWAPVGITAAAERVCFEAPEPDGYRIVRLTAGTPGERVSGPLDVHLSQGAVVGLVRRESEGEL